MSELPAFRKRWRAWLEAFAWLALLYATAPSVFAIVQWTRRHFSLDYYGYLVGIILLFLGGWFLVLMARRTRRGVRWPALKWLVFTGLCGGAVWAFWTAPGGVAKIHLLQYGVLAALFLRAVRIDLPDASAPGIALALASVGGIGDELIQGFLADRVGDLSDVTLNVLAASLGLGFAVLFLPAGALRWNLPARSARWLCWSVAFGIFSVALFCTLNPDLRFGIRHENTPAGTFYSVLTLEQLDEEDRRAAENRARELARWRNAQREDFAAYLDRKAAEGSISPEARKLFGQIYDHYLFRNELMQRFELRQAYIETAVGDLLYDGFLTGSAPEWGGDVLERLPLYLKERLPAPPLISQFVPDGTPRYEVRAEDESWTARSLLPLEAVRSVLGREAGRYRAALADTHLSAYREYLRRYDSKSDQFLREMRVHLFVRDLHASAGGYRVALGENRILETYFGRTLRKTAFAWTPEAVEAMSRAGFFPQTYESHVGRDDFVFRITLRQVWFLCGAAILLFVLLGVLPLFIWPKKECGEQPVPPRFR